MVAINKIDLPSANIDRVKKQLQEQGLSPEDWGGETIVCPVSATKGTGIDRLLEMISLQAEVMELKASPTATPRGTVIEAQVEAGRGPTATVIVQMGTLKSRRSFHLRRLQRQGKIAAQRPRQEHQGSRSFDAGEGAGFHRAAKRG